MLCYHVEGPIVKLNLEDGLIETAIVFESIKEEEQEAEVFF